MFFTLRCKRILLICLYPTMLLVEHLLPELPTMPADTRPPLPFSELDGTLDLMASGHLKLTAATAASLESMAIKPSQDAGLEVYRDIVHSIPSARWNASFQFSLWP